jgi:hypothetical protein
VRQHTASNATPATATTKPAAIATAQKAPAGHGEPA